MGKPWWCDCKSGLGYRDEHPSECMGEQPAFPKLTAALNERRPPEGPPVVTAKGEG
jgi:hypothetical protein